ncbi:MAG TPA: hypothetical protein VIG24_03965 [Acidimicrobiia bacterium]
MTAITPLSDLARRIPVVGKLRSGKYARGRPQAIDTWRLTTSSREFADDFAAKYGGTVEPMTNSNSPHTWEVTSEANEVSIALINDGYRIAYELWAAGGCQRRCDGVTAEVLQTTGPDDVEYVPSPCICDRKQELECSLKSRLTMILPDLPFRGGVVYETGSRNFAEESQGMLALLSQLQSSGVTRGVLRLEQRKSSGGRRFTIAVVGVTESPEALASGMAGMRSLGRADESVPPAAIEMDRTSSGVGVEDGEVSAPAPDTSLERQSSLHSEVSPDGEDDIVDAEIVYEPDDVVQESNLHGGDNPHGDTDVQEVFTLDPADRSRIRAAFMARVKGLGLSYDDQIRPWISSHYGVEGGWSNLDDSQAYSLYRALIVPDGSRDAKEDAERRFVTAVQEYTEAAA